MAHVNTARGEIDADELGPTLMHEHLMLRSPGVRENWPHLWTDDQCAEAERRLKELEGTVVRTIVDVTTADMGRDVQLLEDLQAGTQINVVVATGVYWLTPVYFMTRTADEIAELFVREIRDGIHGSSVKAGIIKLATDRMMGGLTPFNELCLRGGARAQRATGVPITTHTGITGDPAIGLQQVDVFADEGVDLSRVVIGHVGDSTDLAALRQIMDRGCTIGMDRFGVDQVLSLADRVATVAALCREGYADRMVLSHDAVCCGLWMPEEGEYGTKSNPNYHFGHIPADVIPAMRDAGVPEADIDDMLVRNPARLLGVDR